MEQQMTPTIEWTEAEKQRFAIINRKQTEKRYQVAFCGHFSAGKSTILNEFIGSDVLPTSPIPTSANLISIQHGDLGLVVKSRDGNNQNWKGQIPWEKVAEWGRDGVGIEEVAIYAPLPFLENDAAVFDTPGVDSTDPTHQSITMEALYSMDLIVYVMDYNHVQSETNLYFLKQLSQEKKPLYIVINQVDKHDESELSFTEFSQSVKLVFEQWSIRTSRIFYTSMKKREHKHNQFPEFEQELKAIMYQGRQLAEQSVTRLKQGFYLSQAARLTEEGEASVEQVVEQMEEQGFQESQLVKQAELIVERDWLLGAKKHFIDRFESEWSPLFKQVTIFPATTTDLTRSWLESIEPSFKMGLLFAKKKTEEERENRLQKLIQETQDKVNSQLVFHLQQSFEQVERYTLSNSDEIDKLIEHFSFEITPRFFQENVKTGTKNREYVYTFTRERTDAIVRGMREQARIIVEKMAEGQETYWAKQLKDVESELRTLEEVEAYAKKVTNIKQEYEELVHECENIAATFDDEGLLEQKIDQAKQQDVPEDRGTDIEWIQTNDHTSVDKAKEPDHEELQVNTSTYDASWISPLKEIAHFNQKTEALQFDRSQLLSRINRVENQSFIISLFGAFSAGKSSFANALFGANVLPVSPHPTTATVSTVKQSDDKHETGTATVQVKSETELSEEIRMVATKLDLDVTLESISKWSFTSSQNLSGWQKTYAEYLHVLKKSLARTTWDLGESFAVSHQDLRELVAEEQFACLLHSVTVYHDCEFTLKGLILVDTPGVNSIHGRHTNVAFNQLRQSDAIFYVTYYNHAFSKTDQLFLEQMGKINESFQTDKLYFIVNAADLASGERELQGVKQHVSEQLQTLGIKQPRLYTVSSKQGLKAKLDETNSVTDFSRFEEYFYQQIVQELKSLSYRLLEDETKRYLNKLQESVQYARSEKAQQEQIRNQLAIDIRKWKEDIEESNAQPIATKIKQEASQLFLYLRERMGYRLRDEFSEYLNVATIRGKNRKEKRFVIEQMIAEWTQEAEFFLEQECSATHIRLSEALTQACKQWMKDWEKRLQQKRPTFYLLSELEQMDLAVRKPDFSLTIEPEKYSSIYTTDKAFFEGQQIRTLKEQLIADGTDSAGVILLKEEEKTNQQLDLNMNQLEGHVKSLLKEALTRELEQLDALTHEEVITSLATEYQELSEYVPK
ncbi:dynamin family protein [Alkalicoccobacillus plakortidis]|uniref:Dynamin family protein n=1 Tax=Alkalicoccobacillus plakortidis TaxID=444060 RepID=A0ABT0XEQ5_9BACI|nr:dynamin family protein [Alkalicoccobacillus plakortidis]MCM2674374.1 dynamin family protein [Alkalicoccobacillus plakortidis]